MDRIDRRILIELQRDATIGVANLAERVGLSQTPCWKRVQKLEARGIITGRVAVVDAAKVGVGLTVFAEIEALEQTEAWMRGFRRALAAIPEIVEVSRLAGAPDYLLRLTVRDVPSYEAIHARLAEAVPLRACRAHFVLETVKRTHAVPIPAAE